MEQRELCVIELTENEVKDALNKMENNKTPGNDGLTKEIFETFWLEIKSPLLLSFKKGFLTEKLSTSQKQTVLSLCEKKKIDKSLSKNRRSIYLLNTDVN